MEKDIVDELQADRESHITLLQDFVGKASTNPPGDTVGAAAVLQKYLDLRGIENKTIAPKSQAPNVVATFSSEKTSSKDDASGRSLVLNGHIDTFPVEQADSWKRDPFSGEIADGRLHGCGSVDMKAGTAALVIAYAYLYKHRAHLTGRCVLEAVSDEENGGKFGSRYLLEQDEREDLWAGTCVLNTEPGGLDSIRFGEKGTLRMTFRVTSNGGNGAYVFKQEGAIRITTRLIEKLVGLERLEGVGMDPELAKYLKRSDVREVADDIMGPGAGEAMMRPTVNIGTIKGGAKVNTIPAMCIFEVDIRIPIGMTADKIISSIEEMLADFPEASYDVQEAASNPSAFSCHTHEMVHCVQQASAVATPDSKKPLPICSLAATDCKHFRYHGIPAYTIGPRPDGMGQRDESVSVREFLDTVKIVTLAAWDYLGGAKRHFLEALAIKLATDGPVKTHSTQSRLIQLLFGGQYIVRTTAALFVWEHPYYPQLYIPWDVITSSKAKGFTAKEGPAITTNQGEVVAHRWTLAVGEKQTDRCIVFVDDLTGPGKVLSGLVKVDFGAMDQWFEEATPIFVHPKDPFRRVDTIASTRPIRVFVKGELVAETRSCVHLFETGLPVRFYMPMVDVRAEVLRPSKTKTLCPYKGEAEYYSVDLGAKGVVEDVVWFYTRPTMECAKIEGLLCFYNEKVDIVVDGEMLKQPDTHFSTAKPGQQPSAV